MKARYFRFLDTKDCQGLGGVFTSDAVIDFHESIGRVDEQTSHLLTHGAKTSVRNLGPMMKDVVSAHQGFMLEITIVDAATASGIRVVSEKLRADPGSAMPFRWADAWGHYHERHKTAEGWKIQHLRLTRLRVDMG